MTRENAIAEEHSRAYGSEYLSGQLFESPRPEPGWHVLWTRSNYEKIVRDILSAKGYETFLPMISQWSRRKVAGERRTCRIPMFKGYLFVHHAVDKEAYIDISNTNGLVSILGSRWDRLAYVPDEEIETIRLATASHLPATPYPYLETGSRVRITRGPLQNAEGILAESDRSTGLFVISVNLLRRSVAVEVDFADVVPA